MTARVLVSNRNGTAGSTYRHHRPEHAMKIIIAGQRKPFPFISSEHTPQT